MTRDQAAPLKRGDSIIVRFGSGGSQYAVVTRRRSDPDRLFVLKWQRKRRRWTSELSIGVAEIMSLTGPLSKAAFFVDKDPQL